MPVDVLALPASSMSTKWKEPYASASINQKLTGIIAPGIYRGLLLAQDPFLGDRTVLVKADPTSGDHVAVYQNAAGYSLTYRDAGSGDITLSLAAYSNVVVIISVFIDYQPGTDTTGSFRVFTSAEFNALSADIKNALVIAGTVTVPVSGAISPGNITLLNRTLASNNLPTGAIPNAPIVRNPGFELGEINGTYARSSVFWDKSFTVGSGTWKTSNSVVHTGLKSIEMNVTSGPVTGELSQQMGIETAEGELFIIESSVKQMKTVSSGSISLFLDWSDSTDAVFTTTSVSLNSGLDASFRTVKTIVAAPAGAVMLRAVGVRASTLSPSSTGIFMYIDNVDVFVQPRDPSYPYPFDQAFRRPVATTRLALEDPTTGFSGLSASLRQDVSTPSGEGRILLEPNNPSSLPPALDVLGRLYKLGSGLLSTETDGLKPRIEADISVASGSDFTLMWQSARAGESVGLYSQPVVRIYSSSDGQWALTSNAAWNGTAWAKDISGQKATKLAQAKDGLRLLSRVADGTWNDVSWTDSFTITNTSTTNMQLSTPTPSASLDALFARMSHGVFENTVTDVTLITELRFGALKVRIYGSSDATSTYRLQAVLNASWDGTQWVRDTSATGASRLVMEMQPVSSFGSSFWRFQFVDATTTATWADATWVSQASVDQYGAHFSLPTTVSKAIYVTPINAITNDGQVFYQKSLNQSYWTIAAGRGGGAYMYYPLPYLSVGWKLVGYELVLNKQDTGGSVTTLLVNARDQTEASLSAGASLSLGGLNTSGYYAFGETFSPITVNFYTRQIFVPGHLTVRPNIFYVRVQGSATATGGSDILFGVMFYYCYVY